MIMNGENVLRSGIIIPTMTNEPNKSMTENNSVELNINKSENLSNRIGDSIESNSIEINEEIVNIY